MMVTLTLQNIVSPHHGQLSLCLDVQWHLLMLCNHPWPKAFQQGSGGRVKGNGMNKGLHTIWERKSRALLLCFQKPHLLVVEQQCLLSRCGYVDLCGQKEVKSHLDLLNGEMASRLLWQKCRAAVFSPKHWLRETLLFLLWRLGYLGNLFLAGYLLRWRAYLYLLLLCFEMAVSQKNIWQEYFQSWIIVETRLWFWSQVFESDDGVGSSVAGLKRYRYICFVRCAAVMEGRGAAADC